MNSGFRAVLKDHLGDLVSLPTLGSRSDEPCFTYVIHLICNLEKVDFILSFLKNFPPYVSPFSILRVKLRHRFPT